MSFNRRAKRPSPARWASRRPRRTAPSSISNALLSRRFLSLPIFCFFFYSFEILSLFLSLLLVFFSYLCFLVAFIVALIFALKWNSPIFFLEKKCCHKSLFELSPFPAFFSFLL